MITNPEQLKSSISRLEGFRDMLEALRLDSLRHDSNLFPTLSESYLLKIHDIEDEIISYLREHPADAPVSIRIQGPKVRHGVIKASVASKLISGFQSALFQLGRVPEGLDQEGGYQTTKRKELELNLIATSAGSFILALDTSSDQIPLFAQDDPALVAVERLVGYVQEIQESPNSYTGDRPALLGLRKISSVLKAGVESIEINVRDKELEMHAQMDLIVRERIELLLGAPEPGERTVRGQLIEINIESNGCKVHPVDQPVVDCAYEEEIEEDLINAIGKEIEMAGQFIPIDRPAGHFRITRIERFRVVDDDDQ